LKSQALRFLTTLVVAVAAGLFGAFLAAHHRPAFLQPPEHSDTLTFRDVMHRVLDAGPPLSPAQKAAVAKIDEGYLTNHNLIRADVQASNAELAAALADDMSLNPAAKKAINELQLNIGEMQTVTVNYIIDVRGVLTPDQRRTFDDHIVAAMMVHAP
jgi:Spy/CpxP family protein refolding chaperone